MAEKKEKRYVSDNAQLMVEWNWEKNSEIGLDPHVLTVGSERKVWWKCCNGHEWDASIANRYKGNGCPYCSGKKVLVGYNDSQTVNPELSAEWNYERNGGLKPEGFSANSSKKVWWKCSAGHEWQAAISSRNKNHWCPSCSGRYAVKGKNDLRTAKPALADEWNYEKNRELKPEDFTPSSSKKVWWKCGRGHEWQAAIYSRSNGAGCPYCSGNKTLKGYNDLKTINPSLANEWNYEKNNGLTPEDVTPGSDKKVWWKCSKGHEWQSTVGHRHRGRGCPYCAGRKMKQL